MLELVIGILLVILLFFIIVMIVDGNRFVVREYTIESEKIQKEQTLAVLADLHNKTYGKENTKLLAAIERVHPDIVLSAGDMLTAKPGRSFETAASFMEMIAARYPVYYGLGNHEYRMKIYPEDYGDAFYRYMERMKKAGVRVLDNETAEADSRLCITGVSIDRMYYKRFRKIKMEDEYLKETLGEHKEGVYQILLAHNPEYFEEYAAWGADLVLSGHVHGGIMRLPLLGGVISPKLVLFPKYDGGRFYEKDSTMILSRGLGMHTLPIRIFNPAELVVIHLLPCKSR